jgi:L,D-transpeptidase ErfK/SrfK
MPFASALIAALCAACISTPLARRAAAEPLPVFDRVAGREIVHHVTSGETLGQIAARFGMKLDLAVAINHLGDPNRLHIGQRLLLSNQRIVPTRLRDGLVINAGDLRLYWLRDGAVVETFPVGVGRAAWRTPPGHYRIISRRRDPIWHVPPSIQREMRERGEPVKKKVLPGPDNPLGKYWLQLSVPGYGIHGTNAPWSVGKYTTHGCIRLRPDDIERLYNEVPNGIAVDIVDEPIKLARLDDTVLLEAHRGTAEHPAESAAAFLERLQASQVADFVDFSAAQQVLRNAWGIAVDISKKNAAAGGHARTGQGFPLPRGSVDEQGTAH